MSRRQRILVCGATAAAMAAVALAAVFVCSLQRGLHTPQPSKLMLDRRGHYLGEVSGHRGRIGYWPLPPVLPEKIIHATLETEDQYFYHHAGVHLPSVLRALAQYMAHGQVISGASTIAMQVARLQRPSPRTLWAKARESAEALLLVRDHGHDRVLRQYLTLAPYGNRVRGIVRAARYYFAKPIRDLSWLQVAFLVGLPQAPGRMNPHRPEGLERGLRRARLILARLNRLGHLDDTELRQALASELGLVDRPERRAEAMHAVLRWSELVAERPGFIHDTSIDLELQRRAADRMAAQLKRLRWRGAGNAALLVVDRDTGEVLVYLGSNDYFAQEPRGAIDYLRVKRPPGSALKPFVYALAFEQGNLTAASQLGDIQVEFIREHNSAYRPHNIGHDFLGPMLAREALANSRNIPALEVLSRLGVERALQFFDAAGVAGIDYDPGAYGLGLVLGNLHVTLEELVALYGVLAHDGRTRRLRFFPAGQGAQESPSALAAGARLLSPGTAQLVAHILADPVARKPTFARGNALEYDYGVAVKTGTSQGYRDGWAVAFSDRLIVGAWIGNHDWRRMNRVGGLSAARIVRSVMDDLMARHESHRAVAEQVPSPQGYERRLVCGLSGRLAGPHCPHRRVEYFAPGSAPYASCPYHRKVRLDRRNGLLAGPACPEWALDERVMVSLPERYAAWARAARLEIAPVRTSPLCRAEVDAQPPALSITEPRDGARYVWDPDTPAAYDTVKLAARVEPPDAPIVFLVDGLPVARVEYPHEFRWPLEPGTHSIRAALLDRPQVSPPVTITVRD